LEASFGKKNAPICSNVGYYSPQGEDMEFGNWLSPVLALNNPSNIRVAVIIAMAVRIKTGRWV
jgi:hypothetical protein